MMKTFTLIALGAAMAASTAQAQVVGGVTGNADIGVQGQVGVPSTDPLTDRAHTTVENTRDRAETAVERTRDRADTTVQTTRNTAEATLDRAETRVDNATDAEASAHLHGDASAETPAGQADADVGVKAHADTDPE